ncbi:MAG: hypothetical protein AAFX93_02655 [Verrucomicrobiota bacterium]
MKALLSLISVVLLPLSAIAVDAIDKKVVVDMLNARRAAYLAGDPAPLIRSASPDITVTIISSIVEGPAGTRQMRMPQYAPFLKEAFANTEYYAYQFKGVKAQIADDGQSAKVFVDIEEEARVQGLPVTAEKALVISLILKDGDVKVASLTEKIENVDAGARFKSKPEPVEPTGGAGQTSVKIGQ